MLRHVQNHILASIVLNGKELEATIDTGATRSFVNQTVVQSYCDKESIVNLNLAVRLADGASYIIRQGVVGYVEMGGKNCEIEFLVMSNSIDPVILGMDFLAQMNASVTIGNCKLQLELGQTSAGRTTCTRMTEDARREEQCEIGSPITGNNYTAGKEQSEDIADPEIEKFIEEMVGKFEAVRGPSNIAEHKVLMKDDRPIKQRYYPRNPAMQELINEEINKLLEIGCIEPSHSPYSSPIVMVKKPSGEWRLCIDFRQINARAIPDAYPLPRIGHILDQLRNAEYISSIDLRNGYWQIPMEVGSKQYTAFTVPGRGLYHWRVMPFGLHSAPATFQRALDSVIGPKMEPFAFAYLDDIIVTGQSLEEHKRNLTEVLNSLLAANLKINPEKCKFFKRELRYLGHLVSGKGIHTDPEKILAIEALKPPTNLKELQRCLGIASWYRRFVHDYSDTVQPLTALTRKSKSWKWGDVEQKAFEELKKKLTEAPVLACPDFSKQFVLQTDASDYGLGVMLTQGSGDEERVIAYASRFLRDAERNYSATEKECLAIYWGVIKFREYLELYHFKVITDHMALKWLNTIESPTGRIAKWALELQAFSFEIEYRKGKLNVMADALSRQPAEVLNRVVAEAEAGCQWLNRQLEEVAANPAQYPEYVVENGQLYRHLPSLTDYGDEVSWKLCVASGLRDRVLMECHDNPTGGHLGARKTLAKVSQKYFWPGMSRQVKSYVRKCELCQKYKVQQLKPAGKMLSHIAEEPWITVCTDFVGPLPRSKHGNTMLLVVFDKFSKWVELVALRKATTESLIKSFRERILPHFGVPKVLITDNGAQFSSKKFGTFLEDWGIRHQFTAPYTPQENPTERANRTVKTMIAQFTGDDHRKWDELLPEISLAINSSVSATTNYSPAYLCQGREFNVPGSLYSSVTLGSGKEEESAEAKAQRLAEVFDEVRRSMVVAAQQQAHHYNLRRRQWMPEVGQQVWVKAKHLSNAADSFAAKLAPKYDGPYLVQGFKSPVIVQLQKQGEKKIKTAHISDLKSCVLNSNSNITAARIQGCSEGDQVAASSIVFQTTLTNGTGTAWNQTFKFTTTMEAVNNFLKNTKDADLDFLRPGRWLDDRWMDAYLQYLLESLVSAEKRGSTKVVSSFFFAALMQKNWSWEQQVERARLQLRRVVISHCDLVVVPVCDQKHWVLVVVWKPNLAWSEMSREVPLIMVCDSLTSRPRSHLVHTMRAYLEEETKALGGSFDWSRAPAVYAEVPQQQNKDDCGLFTLKCAESLWKNPIQCWKLPLQSLRGWFTVEEAENLRHELIRLATKSPEQKAVPEKIVWQTTAAVDDGAAPRDVTARGGVAVQGDVTAQRDLTPKNNKGINAALEAAEGRIAAVRAIDAESAKVHCDALRRAEVEAAYCRIEATRRLAENNSTTRSSDLDRLMEEAGLGPMVQDQVHRVLQRRAPGQTKSFKVHGNRGARIIRVSRSGAVRILEESRSFGKKVV